MAAYLTEKKEALEQMHIELFERAWKEIVEPALKESYANGLEAGRKGEGAQAAKETTAKRKTWGKRRE
jgi:hypothetical protein